MAGGRVAEWPRRWHLSPGDFSCILQAKFCLNSLWPLSSPQFPSTLGSLSLFPSCRPRLFTQFLKSLPSRSRSKTLVCKRGSEFSSGDKEVEGRLPFSAAAFLNLELVMKRFLKIDFSRDIALTHPDSRPGDERGDCNADEAIGLRFHLRQMHDEWLK